MVPCNNTVSTARYPTGYTPPGGTIHHGYLLAALTANKPAANNIWVYFHKDYPVWVGYPHS